MSANRLETLILGLKSPHAEEFKEVQKLLEKFNSVDIFLLKAIRDTLFILNSPHAELCIQPLSQEELLGWLCTDPRRSDYCQTVLDRCVPSDFFKLLAYGRHLEFQTIYRKVRAFVYGLETIP